MGTETNACCGERKKVTEDQYGGRKNNQAQSTVLNKVLYYNINAQTLQNTEYDDDDLRSNYDREMVDLVLLEAQVKHSLHQKNANFVRQFINHQKFYIKTGYITLILSKMLFENIVGSTCIKIQRNDQLR